MRKERNSIDGLAGAAGVAVILVLAGCAANSPAPKVAGTSVAPKAEPAGVVLEYKMPAGRVLRYQIKEDMIQKSEAMGQTIESLSSGTATYAFQSKGRKDRDLLLGVTIEDKTMSMTGIQGDMSPDMKSVKGKSFDMVLSPLGAEVDVSGAESITYDFATGTRSVANDFKIFFPDLPGKPLKVGDSWPSTFAIEEKVGPADMRLDFQTVNTLEGFETVDGLACARIRANVTGTISGTGSQQGLEMLFGGTHQGTDVWYFAVKEGFFVKSTSELTTDATISISGPQNMTIPSKSTRKSEVILASR
jgi:hypothetical protein